jgi:HEAT repeat protein
LVIKRSSSAEVTRLLEDVLGEDRVAREAAVARLAIAGPRAVDRVTAALAGTPPPAQAIALLQVLERMGDPRALPTLEAYLDASEDDVAAGAVAALRPLLRSGRSGSADRALARLTAVALAPGRADLVRSTALDALHDLGPEVVAPLHRALAADPSRAIRRLAGWPDPGTQAGQAPAPRALELEAVAEALPDDPEAVRTVVSETGSAVPLTVLHRLVTLIRDREERAADPLLRRQWIAARGAVHQILAERGSRVALYDLRETLERRPGEMPVTMLAALGTVGDRTCLEPLADAIERSADPWLTSLLVEAFHAIRQRERLTRRHAVVRRIEARHGGLPGPA